MFSNFLSSLTKPWQVVDDHGDVINANNNDDDDDVSSISSGWSFMQADDNDGSPSRSESPHVVDTPDGVRSLDRSPVVLGRRRQSLPNSMDSPVRLDASARAVAHSKGASSGTTTTSGLLRSGLARSKELSQADRPVIMTPDPVDSRKSNTRWNGAAHACRRRAHRNTLNVDQQRAKCLRRGAQISHSYQRKQVSLLAGGQLPQSRRN